MDFTWGKIMKNTILVNGKRKTCRIYDMGESMADRYTVAFRGYRVRGRMVYPYLACDANPFHPMGFGQHGESNIFISGREIGKRVTFDAMSDQVKRFILDNI